MKEKQNFPFKNLIPYFISDQSQIFEHHLQSFNYLLNTKIKQIMFAKVNNKIQSEVKPQFFIKYKDIRVQKPEITENFSKRKLYPMECRLRDQSYSGLIQVDVQIQYIDERKIEQNFEVKDITIGQIPIMIGSEFCWLNKMNDLDKQLIQECPLDPPGYFIINGVEKVILMQEQLCRNKILVEIDNKTGLLMSSCASSTLETKSKINIFLKNNVIYLKSSSFKELIPLFLIFKAMGIESDKEIVELINPFLNQIEYNDYHQHFENLIYLSFEQQIKSKIFSSHEALDYLSHKIKYLFKEENSKNFNQRINEVKVILQKIILPHIHASENNYLHKINFLSLMVRKLLRQFFQITQINEDETDIRNDRDYLANKRIECAGDMLSLIFEDLFKRFNYEVKKDLDKYLLRIKNFQDFREKRDHIVKMLCQSNIITTGMTHSISSGNWSIKRFKLERKGVTQVMSRLNYYGALGLLTRLESHVEKTRKVSGPRSLQCSHWGFICPVDTPDGENCGLVKNLALLTRITSEIDDFKVLQILNKLELIELGLFDLRVMNEDQQVWGVVMNGKIIGGIYNRQEFIKKFKQLRKQGIINKYISVFEDELDRVIEIWTDAGRLVRPLINLNEYFSNQQKFQEIIKKYNVNKDYENGINDKYKSKELYNHSQELIKELVDIGILEYLDVNELNNTNIKFQLEECDDNTTHLELSYNIILGILAGMIPFPHHNQSPRNTYQCAMGKQALGLTGYNHHKRIDTVTYQMIYPQKPLVSTKTLELTHFNELPAGQNANIAIMSFSGFDIEDAVVISKSSIERGFGRIIQSKKEIVNFERGVQNNGDILVKDENNQDGIIKIQEEVNKGDILVNKYNFISKEDATPKIVRYKGREKARVNKVYVTSGGDNYLIVKLLLSQLKIPEVGDKFSSRHGQKGVIGIKVTSQDLPFSENGWSPDIIMNPHGFPSRMTVGKLLELLTSKAGSLKGKIYKGTAFEDKQNCYQCKDKKQKQNCLCNNVSYQMGRTLLEYGYNYQGNDLLISGTTGEYIPGYIFSGPVYYQRLKHMVSEKIHSRATGKKTFLTRQPLEGRAKEGGLRLGEMERDCLLAYGASEVLLERFLYSSDEYQCPICDKCGGISCLGRCQKDAQIKYVKMPYPTKLLFQELLSMNINLKIELKNNNQF